MEEAGGSIAGDGGEFIYALRGNSTSDFWRYHIAEDRWESLPDTLEIVDRGSGLAVVSGDIYALRGGGSDDFLGIHFGACPDGDACCPSTAYSHTRSHSYGYSCSSSHAGSNGGAYAFTCADEHSGSYAHASADGHAHPDAYAHAYTHAYTHAHPHPATPVGVGRAKFYSRRRG